MDDKKIGLKFCGGCRSTYDRAKKVNEILHELNIKPDYAHENDEYDLLLTVCGCQNKCADISKIKRDKNIYLDKEEDKEKFKTEIKKYLSK